MIGTTTNPLFVFVEMDYRPVNTKKRKTQWAIQQEDSGCNLMFFDRIGSYSRPGIIRLPNWEIAL